MAKPGDWVNYEAIFNRSWVESRVLDQNVLKACPDCTMPFHPGPVAQLACRDCVNKAVYPEQYKEDTGSYTYDEATKTSTWTYGDSW